MAIGSSIAIGPWIVLFLMFGAVVGAIMTLIGAIGRFRKCEIIGSAMVGAYMLAIIVMLIQMARVSHH